VLLECCYSVVRVLLQCWCSVIPRVTSLQERGAALTDVLLYDMKWCYSGVTEEFSGVTEVRHTD
jgi:hypothetical protein